MSARSSPARRTSRRATWCSESRGRARKLMQEYSHLREQCWGRHLRARGSFVASSGGVTDEAILEYIRTQDVGKEDGDCRVEVMVEPRRLVPWLTPNMRIMLNASLSK